jgi:hypothetical protein
MKKILFVAMVALLGVSFVGASVAIASECERSPGYWKNHQEAWQGATILVGGTAYNYNTAVLIMKQPVKGDKSLTLFKATVAATLNVEVNGCEPPPLDCPPIHKCWKDTNICDPLQQANAWLADNNVLSGVGAFTDEWQYSHGEDIYLCLDAYNNGIF